MTRSARAGLALAWLAVALVLSFGIAGIVAGIDHPPGPARPDLTWAADTAVRPILDEAVADLERMADDAGEVSLQGRGALAALLARDEEIFDRTLAAGGEAASAIESRAAALRVRLGALPEFGRGVELRVGEHERRRYDVLVDALDATTRFEEAWGVLTRAGLTGTRLTALLEGHDEAAFDATAAARSLDYAGAVEHLDQADALIAEARALRERLAPTIDVATLDEWLRRNAAYDAALRRLYTAFRDSGGRVTAEVREAILAERAARAELPPDTRGLVIIMSDVSRGGANQAVIEIEQQRGRLEVALSVLRALDEAAAGR